MMYDPCLPAAAVTRVHPFIGAVRRVMHLRGTGHHTALHPYVVQHAATAPVAPPPSTGCVGVVNPVPGGARILPAGPGAPVNGPGFLPATAQGAASPAGGAAGLFGGGLGAAGLGAAGLGVAGLGAAVASAVTADDSDRSIPGPQMITLNPVIPLTFTNGPLTGTVIPNMPTGPIQPGIQTVSEPASLILLTVGIMAVMISRYVLRLRQH